jgi:hypothetical protein
MKPVIWYADKQVWFGIAWALLAVVQVALGFFGYNEFTPSPDLVSIVALLNAVIVILLRWFTTRPVTLHK